MFCSIVPLYDAILSFVSSFSLCEAQFPTFPHKLGVVPTGHETTVWLQWCTYLSTMVQPLLTCKPKFNSMF